ncbi:murein biosynthesis integral membrane protein MurJ [Virgisporangium aliadipatigenens]|uniref:murein biosynthesis integral membrane protein MurJ n=1 Tax=Virgisporangium aliadipatigenens TaxID=741659 RepID=UPI0019445233|nr:murein biosynthesis integral membrane protein MurJ [Virgisporangium aliadipatigenens]
MTDPRDGDTVPIQAPALPQAMAESVDNATTLVFTPVTPPPSNDVTQEIPVATAGAAQPEEPQPSVARNSAVMAVGSLVSRASGFLRTAAIAAAIGGAAVADDYALAVALPNMVFELLVGGVLSSVIVPVLVRTRKQDADRGQAYAQRLLSLAVIALGIATALAVAAAPVFTWILTNRNTPKPETELVTHLAYLILPAIFFYGMAALFAAILNTRGSFAAPMWTPILNNIVVILTAVVFIVVDSTKPTPESISTTQIMVLGLGTMLGILVQAAGLYPALRKVGFRWKWRFDFRKLGLGELGRLGAWMLLFVVVNQVGLFIVLKIAKRAGTDDPNAASVAIFQNAFLIFMMAHGIVAVSVLTALLPRLSSAAADGRHGDLISQMAGGIRLVAVVLVPITAAYLVLGQPLAVTLFQWGNYESDEAIATGTVIAVAGLSLIPYAIMQMQQFAFYALRDTRSPSLINIPVVVLRIAFDVAFYVLFPATAVAAGLMGGSALSFVAGALLSFALLRRRFGTLGMRRVVTSLLTLSAAAAVAAVPTWLLRYLLEHQFGDGKLSSATQLVLCGVVLIGGYIGATFVLRVPEVRDLSRMVRSRLGR